MEISSFYVSLCFSISDTFCADAADPRIGNLLIRQCLPKSYATLRTFVGFDPLLPGEKPVYLYSAGIREIDRGALNETLARHGLRVRSKATYSERRIKTRIDQERWAAHTQFWLEPLSALGVADETDD